MNRAFAAVATTLFALSFSDSYATECQLGTKVPFVDDAALNNPKFGKFRDGVLDLVKRKQVDKFKKVIADKIEYSFGSDPQTRDGFLKAFGLSKGNGKESELWGHLQHALQSGGVWTDPETFCFPYYVYAIPASCAGSIGDKALIVGQNVPVQATKHGGAEIDKVSEEIVSLPDSLSIQDGMMKVGTTRQKTGFVKAESVANPFDYRGCFKKTAAGWNLTTFVAGD